MYDPKDPWNGLLRSGLLVCVSLAMVTQKDTLTFFRLISMYSRRQVLSIRNRRPLIRVMPVSMACEVQQGPQLLMLQLKYVVL
jgi:hypothetical protein